jgi:hypothetical protein
MFSRCSNPNNRFYHAYGGRGIVVCERWKSSFKNFLSDMGEAPSGKSIERIDNNKGYCKSNCKWATRKEQQRNMRSNHLKTFDGETKCIAEWAEEFNIKPVTLWSRLYKYGWSIEKALLTPVKNKNKTQC